VRISQLTRELFKPPKDLASLRVCNKKKIFLVLGFIFVVNDVISKVGFSPFLAANTWAQLLDGSILLKFSVDSNLVPLCCRT